jgi:hypothetical protein
MVHGQRQSWSTLRIHSCRVCHTTDYWLQHLLRNVDTHSAHGQWIALLFLTQPALELQIWGLESCFMFFKLHKLIKCHGIPGTLSKKIWDNNVESMTYNVHCTLLFLQCASYTVLLICCSSNLLYFLYSLFWEFLFLTTNNWLAIWLFWHWVKKDTELGHQVKTGFEGVWGISSLYEGYQEETKLLMRLVFIT